MMMVNFLFIVFLFFSLKLLFFSLLPVGEKVGIVAFELA